ncbi:hypothetical protein [Plantactinospora sp. KLBMP9567]|uniref:hypothetical protein n=1 Tax=Plantactinospora sp. KLBMP9567 TaxID=3085900 RepID=UPI002982312C|nr:hypothetical protein [Plantactinospora sp. KLBMP9567]MDW5328325.1 hypothetical protein [Plantactinospora sp. KLBMP9567]
MTSLTPRRVLAVVLLLIAFITLAASRAFPILDDVSGVAKSAIAVAGAACVLVGVWLWVRKTPDQP